MVPGAPTPALPANGEGDGIGELEDALRVVVAGRGPARIPDGAAGLNGRRQRAWRNDVGVGASELGRLLTREWAVRLPAAGAGALDDLEHPIAVRVRERVDGAEVIAEPAGGGIEAGLEEHGEAREIGAVLGSGGGPEGEREEEASGEALAAALRDPRADGAVDQLVGEGPALQRFRVVGRDRDAAPDRIAPDE